MELLVYGLPIVIFIVICSYFLYANNVADKKDSKNPDKIDIKIVVSGASIVSVIVYFILKYKDNFMTPEPVMRGNYFD